MNIAISQENQRFLDDLVRGGMFPSQGAALDAAIAALRISTESIASVPQEHEAAILAAIASSNAGKSRPMTDDEWVELHRIVDSTPTRQE
jgi:Arc/MetJ-type ribon-helix-helix transcriptional regulator